MNNEEYELLREKQDIINDRIKLLQDTVRITDGKIELLCEYVIKLNENKDEDIRRIINEFWNSPRKECVYGSWGYVGSETCDEDADLKDWKEPDAKTVEAALEHLKTAEPEMDEYYESRGYNLYQTYLYKEQVIHHGFINNGTNFCIDCLAGNNKEINIYQNKDYFCCEHIMRKN